MGGDFMPVIMVKFREGAKVFPLTEGKPLFIGRARECDIHLPDVSVSRRHAVILSKNGLCGVKDFDSFNGTLLNGVRITTPQALNYGDVLGISSYSLVFMAKDPMAEAPAPPPEPANAKPLQSDSLTYANSSLLLPRAMRGAEATAAEAKIITDDIEPGPEPEDGGVDETRAYFEPPTRSRSDRYAFSSATEAPPASTPPDGGRDAAEVGPAAAMPTSGADPDETDYFGEPPSEGDDGMWAAARSTPADSAAEEIIPLHDSETRELLVLDDDEMNPAAAMRGDFADPEAAGRAPFRVMTAEQDSPELRPADGADGRGVADDDQAAADGFADPGGASGGDETDVFLKSVDGARTARAKGHVEKPPSGLARIDVPPALLKAIDARLALYEQLDELVEQRKVFRSSERLPAAVAAELARQDAELDNLPTTGEIERLQRELQAGDASGTNPEMRSAREMAMSQWRLIRDSNRESLPLVYKEAYRLTVDEPLTKELAAARVDHGRLMGGAIYLLALGDMAQAAVSERSRISSRLRVIAGEDDAVAGGGVLGKIGRLADKLRNRQDLKAESARLDRLDKASAKRSELALREMHFMEKTLVREFWKVYQCVALRFIPMFETMPPAVRAFLRHGAIGSKPWWMTDAMREYVFANCRDDVLAVFEHSATETAVLYADEHLAAVSRMECSPSPSDDLARLDKSSIEWKSDRGYRRIVNARSYNTLMRGMLVDLEDRERALAEEIRASEERLRNERRKLGGGSLAAELENEIEGLAIRRNNLDKNRKRIEREVVSSIIAAVEETEGRFRKGELIMPGREQLVRAEVEALADAACRVSGKRERFPPMVLREQASRDGDVINDRDGIRRWLEEHERLDPGVFKATVIPARRKHNRIELRIAPTVVIVPASGFSCLCLMPRSGMEGGRMIVPGCFAREDMRERQLANLLADFRWETSRNLAGRDAMQSDTLVGFFMRLRWEWRNLPKAKREKGLINNEASDKVNWRRIYELYLSDAMNGARQLHQRNPELYAGIVGTYVDLPEGCQAIEQGS